MKKLFKNKKMLIIISAVLAVLLLAGTVFCVTRPKNASEPEQSCTTVSDTNKDVVIDIPDDSESTDAESNEMLEIEDDGNALKPDESIEQSDKKNNGGSAENNNTPSAEVEPPKEAEQNNGGGIHIGNPPVEETYDCGFANHHCQNEDFHASLLNRELEGCPYCGSHSCPSFYAVNEWGYTCYDATLCPSYNVQQDSAKICPDCGRPMWSSDNPTGCFRYLQDTQCECGELVPGNTCHHH